MVPHRLDLPGRAGIDLRVRDTRLGETTVARVAYGGKVRFVSERLSDFHVTLPLRGQAISSTDRLNVVATRPGEAAVFSPRTPARITWLPECEQICLKLPQRTLVEALERLLGRSVRGDLAFRMMMDLRGQGQLPWPAVLHLVRAELDRGPSGRHPAVGQHIESLVQDALLLAQPHTYTEQLLRVTSPGPTSATHRAAELLQAHPTRAWSTVSLAAEVHMSVRSLQEGFKRDFELPPMAYLRKVRLRKAREVLAASSPDDTTVQWVATGLGFVHLPRFAASYRAEFGENPSQTLARPPA